MASERVVRGIVAAPTFQRGLKGIKDVRLRQEICSTIQKLMFLDLDQAPAKLHLHQLSGRKVPSVTCQGQSVAVWTLHVTASDTYKASFTLEDGVAYLRIVDEHDQVDKHP